MNKLKLTSIIKLLKQKKKQAKTSIENQLLKIQGKIKIEQEK